MLIIVCRCCFFQVFLGTAAWTFYWTVVSVSLVLETFGLFCLAEYDLQSISGCDYTYIEQPVRYLNCDPYLNGVVIKCTVIGLQGSSIEWYRSDIRGHKELLTGNITVLETLVIQGQPYRRRTSTLTIDENVLESGQQYWCQVRVGRELLQQSNTLLIESRNYSSLGYMLCSNQHPQFTTVPKCVSVNMDVEVLQPAERKLTVLLPIWLCVFTCVLVLIAIVVIDCKTKRNRNVNVTQRSPCQVMTHDVTPEYELMCDTNLSPRERGIDDGDKYTSTDEERTVYQRLDPNTQNYTSMYAKPALQRTRSPPTKGSEYELIDRLKLDPENPYTIRNPPAKRTEKGMYQLIDRSKLDPKNAMRDPPTREGVYQPLDCYKLDPENPYDIRNLSTKETREGVHQLLKLGLENPYAIRNPSTKGTREGVYQPLKLGPENPYAVGNPSTKETREGVYQLLDSYKLDPENPYAIRNPPAKKRREGV